MVFRIVNFNRELDIYSVISNEGEQRNVTSFQIVRVMLQGYKFDNATLTQKGFALKTDNGTRYIQVKLDKQTQMQLVQYLSNKKLSEEQKRQDKEIELKIIKQREQEKLKEQQLNQKIQAEKEKRLKEIRKAEQETAATVDSKVTKIKGNNVNQKIFYKGNLYYSDEQLCKKFNANVVEFRRLRSKGYSIDEALGLKKLRPESELVSLKQFNRMMDSMALQRGEL